MGVTSCFFVGGPFLGPDFIVDSSAGAVATESRPMSRAALQPVRKPHYSRGEVKENAIASDKRWSVPLLLQCAYVCLRMMRKVKKHEKTILKKIWRS